MLMKKLLFIMLTTFVSVMSASAMPDEITDKMSDGSKDGEAVEEYVVSIFASDPIKKKYKKTWKKTATQVANNEDELSTEEVIAFKNWLYNDGKRQKRKGNWMMISSIPLGIIAPALVCGALKHGDNNDNTALRTVIACGGFSWFAYGLVGGYLNWESGNDKKDKSRLIIVSTPINSEFHIKNLMVSTGVRVFNEPLTHRYSFGPGVTITF